MTENILRQKMVDIGKRLVEENLVQGTWGNISVRLDEKRMLITPSGLDYAAVSPSDMVIYDLENGEYTGLKPSSEKKIHAKILCSRADAGAVIHTHSLYCSVFAAAHMGIDVEGDNAKLLGTRIEIAQYGLPGTKKLTDSTVAAIGKNNLACIMANHGMLACGKDLDEAFARCKAAEEYAKHLLGK